LVKTRLKDHGKPGLLRDSPSLPKSNRSPRTRKRLPKKPYPKGNGNKEHPKEIKEKMVYQKNPEEKFTLRKGKKLGLKTAW